MRHRRSEKAIVDSGVTLLKYWLEVSPMSRKRRLTDRIDDGRKIWKLSEMDVKSFAALGRVYGGSRRYFKATDTAWGAWYVARSDDKKKARLNIISHLLSKIDYEDVRRDKVKLPKRHVQKTRRNDLLRFIPDRY